MSIWTPQSTNDIHVTGGTPMIKNREKRRLGVLIRVEPDATCPLLQFEGTPEYIQSQLVGDTCLCEAILKRSETVIEKSQKTLDSECVCQVFHEHACVADITNADEDAITITTQLSGPTEIEALIEDLRRVTDSLEIVEITNHHDGDLWDGFEEVDVSSITEKERIAAEIAIERGYYKRPRETSIDEMAAELDISQQAFSHRLSAVEEKLFTQLFAEA